MRKITVGFPRAVQHRRFHVGIMPDRFPDRFMGLTDGIRVIMGQQIILRQFQRVVEVHQRLVSFRQSRLNEIMTAGYQFQRTNRLSEQFHLESRLPGENEMQEIDGRVDFPMERKGTRTVNTYRKQNSQSDTAEQFQSGFRTKLDTVRLELIGIIFFIPDKRERERSVYSDGYGDPPGQNHVLSVEVPSGADEQLHLSRKR